MEDISADFETYYSKDYSLRDMTMREYIMDQRFQPIVVGVATKDGREVYQGAEIQRWANSVDWSNVRLSGHNLQFDAAILSWHYGTPPPALYECTQFMSQVAIGHAIGSSSLKEVNRFFGRNKDTEALMGMKGLRYEDIDWSSTEAKRYLEYAGQDSADSFYLASVLRRRLTHKTRMLVHLTVRMFVEGSFNLDIPMLENNLARVKREADQALEAAGVTDRRQISSRDKFAELLRGVGVEPPVKISPANGKMTYAFSKKDLDFIELQSHSDHRVRTLVEAKLNSASTLEETRTERFLSLARNGGKLNVPLMVSGAHTHRYSGRDNLNLQNLPRGSQLRFAMKAPRGYKLVVVDASQIEARILAWLAGCKELVRAFARGDDVYSLFASKLFGFEVNKKDHPEERFVGKTCVGSTTRVLTNRGWVPIVHVQKGDLLWDGEEWVAHGGVSFMGVKPTINLAGLEITKDHLVFSRRLGWVSALSCLMINTVFQSALLSASNPLSDTSIKAQDSGLRYSSVVAGMFRRALTTTCDLVGRLGVMPALKSNLRRNGGTNIKQLCLKTSIGHVCSTAWHLLYPGAITLKMLLISITVYGEYTFATSGEKTVSPSSTTCRPSKAGMNQSWKWIARTTIRVMNRAILCFQHGVKTSPTSAKSKNLKPVFDILNAGSRNRFTVLTDKGPLIIHNCILGLGYGTGKDKFHLTMRLAGQNYDYSFSADTVRTYRKSYPEIPALWRNMDEGILSMITGGGMQLGPITFKKSMWDTVERMPVVYPHLKTAYEPDDRGEMRKQYVYWRHRYNTFEKLYGAKLTENVVQHLAFLQIVDTMARMHVTNPNWICLLQVHDELVYLAPEDEAQDCYEHLMSSMCKQPAWAAAKSYSVPLAAEGGLADSYGEAK